MYDEFLCASIAGEPELRQRHHQSLSDRGNLRSSMIAKGTLDGMDKTSCSHTPPASLGMPKSSHVLSSPPSCRLDVWALLLVLPAKAGTQVRTECHTSHTARKHTFRHPRSLCDTCHARCTSHPPTPADGQAQDPLRAPHLSSLTTSEQPIGHFPDATPPEQCAMPPEQRSWETLDRQPAGVHQWHDGRLTAHRLTTKAEGRAYASTFHR